MTLDSIDSFLKILDNIQGLSAAALVALSCIVVGYALRFIKRFPNDGIPVVVILWGALAMLFIADPRATTMPARIWTARNIMVGLIIGALSWLVHKIVLSRIENLIASKVPSMAGTTFFNQKDTQPNPPADPGTTVTKTP